MANKTNTEQEKQFFSAIKTGDVATVLSCVADDPALLDAYDYDCFGATPLTAVTFKDDREMVETLIGIGADLNRRSDWPMGPWSPLHSAIHSKNDELAVFLLSKGAELDVHTAAALGRTDDLTRMLRENPERVAEQGGDGCTPLHFAGTEAAVDVLIDHGADIEARCIDHFSTPLQYLADRRPDIARYLISKGATVDIFSAALCGAVESLREIVERDSSLLQATISRKTFPPGPEHEVDNIMTFTVGPNCSPLHAAASGDQGESVRMLISMGIDPDIRGGYDDATPLHQAAWHDHLEAARALIECGADVNLLSGDIHNNSAAGWAIVAGSADVFCLLLENGCEVLDFFADDAQAAVDGAFREYKVVPQENYERIRAAIAK